jgi:hypothetical protein
MYWLRAAAVMLVWSGVAVAQDQANPEELNRKYQDSLAQLKAAQDRKNELATENEQLKARITEMEKQLDEYKRSAADAARQTFLLRSQYAAWQSFLQRYPRLMSQWRVFLEGDVLSSPSTLPVFVDPYAPFTANGSPD